MVAFSQSFLKRDPGHSLYTAWKVDHETSCDDREKAQVFLNEFLLESFRIDEEQVSKPDATCNVERTFIRYE